MYMKSCYPNGPFGEQVAYSNWRCWPLHTSWFIYAIPVEMEGLLLTSWVKEWMQWVNWPVTNQYRELKLYAHTGLRPNIGCLFFSAGLFGECTPGLFFQFLLRCYTLVWPFLTHRSIFNILGVVFKALLVCYPNRPFFLTHDVKDLIISFWSFHNRLFRFHKGTVNGRVAPQILPTIFWVF